jgi:hypothetical protein
MLRSGDAVSLRLKSRKITGLSPNHGQITTLLGRLQFVGDKLEMLPWGDVIKVQNLRSEHGP